MAESINGNKLNQTSNPDKSFAERVKQTNELIKELSDDLNSERSFQLRETISNIISGKDGGEPFSVSRMVSNLLAVIFMQVIDAEDSLFMETTGKIMGRDELMKSIETLGHECAVRFRALATLNNNTADRILNITSSPEETELLKKIAELTKAIN